MSRRPSNPADSISDLERLQQTFFDQAAHEYGPAGSIPVRLRK
jgi:hypothetical protein